MSKWLVDIDSTTMDTTPHQLTYINQRFGTTYTVDQITDWDWDICLGNKRHAGWAWGAKCFTNLDFQRTAPVVPGAVEALVALRRQGESIVFVSDRKEHLREVTRAWLDALGFAECELVFTDRETYLKREAARELSLEYVVEDAPHHSLDLAQQDFIRRVFLLDKPYNQVIEHEKITRVSGWEEVLEYVTP